METTERKGTPLRDYPGEPLLEDLFPTTSDKVMLVSQVLFALGFSLAAYRSAWKRNWGAAIWKTVVAQESSRELRRYVERRIAKANADKTKQMTSTEFFKNF